MGNWPKYLAEFIATFALVYVGAGAICTNALTGGAAGLTGIAFAHGLTIMVMVYATAHISGAHINPAVTFAMWITKNIGIKDGLGYWVAQFGGATLAAWFLSGMYPDYLGAAPFLGNPELTTALTTFTVGCGVITEALLTFLLVFVIFAVAVDERGLKPALGLAIGMTVTLDIFIGGPITGAAMNPARALGPALITGRCENLWIYFVGPLLGASAAALVYTKCFMVSAKKKRR